MSPVQEVGQQYSPITGTGEEPVWIHTCIHTCTATHKSQHCISLPKDLLWTIFVQSIPLCIHVRYMYVLTHAYTLHIHVPTPYRNSLYYDHIRISYV